MKAQQLTACNSSVIKFNFQKKMLEKFAWKKIINDIFARENIWKEDSFIQGLNIFFNKSEDSTFIYLKV